jgi:hypothetical protein
MRTSLHPASARTRALVCFALLCLATALAPVAEAQIPNEKATRARISDALGKGDLSAAAKLLAGARPTAAAAAVSGSVVFEEIRACGFYPQETRLACAVDIKLPTGYGGPIGAFGSFEFVQFCVDWDNNDIFDGGESVGLGIVHMHDESEQALPPWQYAVYRDIDPPGGLRTSLSGAGPTTTVAFGATRRARAILSWATAPTGCDFSPVWGNVVDFRIRFDPIR